MRLEAENIPNLKEDSRYNPVFDKKAGFDAVSMLCMPLIKLVPNKSGGSALQTGVGVVVLTNKKRRVLTKNGRYLTFQVSESRLA